MIQSTESICRRQVSPTSPTNRRKIPVHQGAMSEPTDGKDHRKAEGSARIYAEGEWPAGSSNSSPGTQLSGRA